MLTLTSPAFQNSERIPKKYSQEGENVNPPLEIAGVPAVAKSLVLIMEDPDVPKELKPDGLWIHWVVFNIPPDTTKIEEATTPPGVSGIGSRGLNTYSGPKPPDGEHRYFFKLFALDKMLDLADGATKEGVEREMDGCVVGEVELMGRYEMEMKS